MFKTLYLQSVPNDDDDPYLQALTLPMKLQDDLLPSKAPKYTQNDLLSLRTLENGVRVLWRLIRDKREADRKDPWDIMFFK